MSQSLAKSLIRTASLSLVATGKKMTFGVMTDIHMSTKYMPNLEASPTYCEAGKDAIESVDVAHFGRIGCDPPYELVETMIKMMAEENPDLDVILLPGDFSGHGTSLDMHKEYDEATKKHKYEKLKLIF